MGCLKLTEYKQKLPRQWTLLCRKKGINGFSLNQAFSYDNIGNRITSTNNNLGTNYTTNNLNQYTSIASNSSVPSASENTFPPTFDDDGNQTKIKTSTGEWNDEENVKYIWQHSDIRDLPYFFTHPFYKDLVNEGDLKSKK